MQVTVPGGRKVADLVVQCVASHESLGQASVEAVHVIRVTSKSTHVFSCAQDLQTLLTDPTTEQTTYSTTEFRIPLDITEAKEDLEYYEDDGSYYEEEYDTNHLDFNPDDTYEERNPPVETFGQTTESVDVDHYHKYKVEQGEEDNVNHILLVDNEQGEGSGQDTESKTRRSELLEERVTGEMVFSKSEPTDQSSYSKLRQDTVSMTETPQQKNQINKKEDKTVPSKALRVMNSSSNIRYSIIFLILPVFISQI